MEKEKHHIFIIKWKKYKFYLVFKIGTSRNFDLDFLFLFYKDLSLQAMKQRKMAYREKVEGMRVPILPSQQCKGSIPFMDPSPSLIYFSEELGLNIDQIQLQDPFQSHPNHP